MGKLNNYRAIIKKILTEYDQIASQTPNFSGVDTILSFDEERDQYLWFDVGWNKRKRVKAITVHVRMKNDKIYIEEDWTEAGIATELLREGVPKEDIVLAFHDPETRKFTDFAIA
ncbi:MAG: XisI protein [Sphaerospermopsis sp. SIO1G2]|nr:XisI protein [Sphaerospermopsis sp. SIO1G1]NET72747.1 XisI protein [Sphaerospermopsis sp. SIO1G2]